MLTTTDRTTVAVTAQDPISEGGVVGALRPRPEVRVLGRGEQPDEAQVTVVVTDQLDDDALRLVRAARRQGHGRVVLVAGRLDDRDVVAAVEAGVVGMVRRADATPERLVRVVRAAATGEGSLPPDLLGKLLDQVGSLQRQVLQPRGLTFSGLAAREVEVLRLIADGLDTAEVARHLAYSERTVKNVLHDVTSRLQLRNRVHAVAYALREGLI
ncbi:helix-turn-helix transcriptional regulator [Cellulosimicrobium marinum]|uniref:helix-turn-helix transcriptional regulator n=1 Tax=Cellulosimicrobium marinum TaxID=1638992 RepID=UPI001E50A586|nr:response regulator transcription factor [Cellulosimicrobium marinum]MCB7135684.1 response regulator transcription factor [Cellulosimicrobium marinum]